MNPTEVVITFNLDKPRRLYFNNNTFSRFEEDSGKRFFQLFAEAQQALAGKGEDDLTDMDVASALSLKDIHSLVYAACHEYDENDEPHWPLTKGRIGRFIGLTNIAELLKQLLLAVQKAGPREKDMPLGLVKAAADRPTSPPVKTVEKTGGLPSGPSDQSVLDELTHKSESSPPEGSSDS